MGMYTFLKKKSQLSSFRALLSKPQVTEMKLFKKQFISYSWTVGRKLHTEMQTELKSK